jgi:hypothetical protein
MTFISPIRDTAAPDDMVTGGPAEASAVLIARDGRNARIEHNGHILEARVAFGCVVRPEPGDRVLTGRTDGALWVISVLERSSDAPMLLWAEGDVSVVSMRGDVSLTAARSVSLDGGERVRIAAAEIDLHAGVARFVLDEMVQIGRRASLLVGKIRYVGEMIETFAEHVLTRAQRSSRFIEASDQLRAGDMDHRAEGTLQMRAGTMLLSADAVVRVDADQIHMG